MSNKLNKIENGKNSIHPVDAHVGRMLKARRVVLGISQEQLASYVGLTFQQIQKYEKGLNRISCSKLYEFATFLKVPVDYFFENMNSTPEPVEEQNQFNNMYVSDNVAVYTHEPMQDMYSVKRNPDAKEFSDKLDDLIAAFSKIKNEDTKNHVLNIVKSLSKRGRA